MLLKSLEILKNDPFDAIFFLPHDSGNIRVDSFLYTKRGKNVIESAMGHLTYHVFLFKIVNEENEVDEIEEFDAVLIDPLTYISNIISLGIYGFVMVKTTESKHYFEVFKNSLWENKKDDTN